MNVTRASSLKGLADLYTLCVNKVGAVMTPTESGFMITRGNTPNDELVKALLRATNRDDLRYLVKQAWRCGIDNNGGLHIMGV